MLASERTVPPMPTMTSPRPAAGRAPVSRSRTFWRHAWSAAPEPRGHALFHQHAVAGSRSDAREKKAHGRRSDIDDGDHFLLCAGILVPAPHWVKLQKCYEAAAPPSILPESGPARHPCRIGDDGDVGPRCEIDPFGIAATHVEMVEVDEVADLGNGPLHALVPLAIAHPLARRVANVLVI